MQISHAAPVRFGNDVKIRLKAAEAELRKHLKWVPMIHGTQLPGQAFIMIGVRNKAEKDLVTAELKKIPGVVEDQSTKGLKFKTFPLSIKDGIQTLR